MDQEKKAMSEPTFADLMERIRHRSDWTEDRIKRSQPEVFENFRKRFFLSMSLTQKIVISILKDSSHILHNHVYRQEPTTPASLIRNIVEDGCSTSVSSIISENLNAFG